MTNAYCNQVTHATDFTRISFSIVQVPSTLCAHQGHMEIQSTAGNVLRFDWRKSLSPKGLTIPRSDVGWDYRGCSRAMTRPAGRVRWFSTSHGGRVGSGQVRRPSKSHASGWAVGLLMGDPTQPDHRFLTGPVRKVFIFVANTTISYQ